MVSQKKLKKIHKELTKVPPIKTVINSNWITCATHEIKEIYDAILAEKVIDRELAKHIYATRNRNA